MSRKVKHLRGNAIKTHEDFIKAINSKDMYAKLQALYSPYMDEQSFDILMQDSNINVRIAATYTQHFTLEMFNKYYYTEVSTPVRSCMLEVIAAL